ncbi:MAG: AraC family transcriptional regulator [Clostridia bacterium]|nr:AraC family transcriptional regulator [Clostridia bacterium]
MGLHTFNPFIRYITKRTTITTVNKYPDYMYAYDHRLFFIASGEMDFYLNGVKYTLTENEAIIFPPATPYKLKFNEFCEYYILNFDFIFENSCEIPRPPQNNSNFNPNLIFSTATSDVFPVILRCDSESHIIFDRMLNYYIKRNMLYHEFVSAEFKSFVINSMILTECDKSPTLIKDLLAYINKNFTKKITLSDIGDAFSYHPNYLNRIFKKYNGKTIHIYMNNLRLTEAKRLLRTTDLSVSKICELCGFESYSYFIKSFRLENGITPLKYRKINSENI